MNEILSSLLYGHLTSILILVILNSQELKPAKHSAECVAGFGQNSMSLSLQTFYKRQENLHRRKPQGKLNCRLARRSPVIVGFGKFRHNGGLFKSIGVSYHLTVFVRRFWWKCFTKAAEVINDAAQFEIGAPCFTSLAGRGTTLPVFVPGAFGFIKSI